MKGMDLTRGVLVSFAAVGFCLPQTALAAGATAGQVPIVIDVALAEGGVLLGQVVDPQGVPLARMAVSLSDREREIARTVTDSNGYFAVRGLRGGVYQLVAARGQGTFRLWRPGTAPPSAQQGALLVAGHGMVRGQCQQCGQCGQCGQSGKCGKCGRCGIKNLTCWLSNPLVVTGIVATAVAVPVAIHNSRRPASP